MHTHSLHKHKKNQLFGLLNVGFSLISVILFFMPHHFSIAIYVWIAHKNLLTQDRCYKLCDSFSRYTYWIWQKSNEDFSKGIHSNGKITEIRKTEIKSFQPHTFEGRKKSNYFWVPIKCVCVCVCGIIYTYSIEVHLIDSLSLYRWVAHLSQPNDICDRHNHTQTRIILRLFAHKRRRFTRELMKKIDSVTHFKLHLMYFAWINCDNKTAEIQGRDWKKTKFAYGLLNFAEMNCVRVCVFWTNLAFEFRWMVQRFTWYKMAGCLLLIFPPVLEMLEAQMNFFWLICKLCWCYSYTHILIKHIIKPHEIYYRQPKLNCVNGLNGNDRNFLIGLGKYVINRFALFSLNLCVNVCHTLYGVNVWNSARDLHLEYEFDFDYLFFEDFACDFIIYDFCIPAFLYTYTLLRIFWLV